MMTEDQFIKQGLAELRKRGYGNVSRAVMGDWLHNGYCSQDDYDLYIDVWMANVVRLSVSEQASQAAADRLMAKFSLG